MAKRDFHLAVRSSNGLTLSSGSSDISWRLKNCYFFLSHFNLGASWTKRILQAFEVSDINQAQVVTNIMNALALWESMKSFLESLAPSGFYFGVSSDPWHYGWFPIGT